MFTGIGAEGRTLELVDRLNYDITAGLLSRFGEGNKSQVLQGLHGLRSAYCGFASTEIPRHKLGLPDLGVPHVLLLGKTAAEIIAEYIGIDRLKLGKLKLTNVDDTPTCISELVQGGFGTCPGPLRQVAADAKVYGYNTGRGGLVHRMQQLLRAEPQLERQFGESALSTIRANADYISWIQHVELGELVDGLVRAFEWKYQKEVRAVQAVTAVATRNQ